MVKDAEANKEADKKKRESVDVRNQADTLIHSTEKNLKEHGSKISDADKKAIEDGLKAAELGKEEHALAQKNAEALIESSKTQAAEIIANADKQASVMIDLSLIHI